MKKIVIQGLGYVGLAMMVFCAGAKKKGKYLYKVTGVEKKSSKGLEIIKKISSDQTPKIVDDTKFINFYSRVVKDKRIKVSIDEREYSDADVIFVCSNCDYNFRKNRVEINSFLKNIDQISKKIKNNCLLIIQSTLPPGTTGKILEPLIKKNLKKRGIKNYYLCHSFERITPGKDYFSSMKNTQRIVGGTNKKSLNMTKEIFMNIFNSKSKNIIELDSTIESETCKIIENSYRATNIAFIEEWRKFCFKNNLDLEKILSSIRQRKTHKNIMRSGIGVGGYCLTKDPLFGSASSRQILKQKFNFPISNIAVEINKRTTLDIMSEIKNKFNKKIFKKKVLIIGASYREDTNDTRLSPAQGVFDFLKKMKCKISFYDPIVSYWDYINKYSVKKKSLSNFDVYIYLTKHRSFKSLNIKYKKGSLILDLNHVLEKEKKIKIIKNKSFKSYFIGSRL